MYMSKQTPPTHQEYCDWIIQSLRAVNPHTSEQGRIGYVYASGFLAAYLASLMQEDPYIYKRFRKHIDQVKQSRSGL